MLESLVMGCLAVACIATFAAVWFGVLWLNAREDLLELQSELNEREAIAAAHMVAGRVMPMPTADWSASGSVHVGR